MNEHRPAQTPPVTRTEPPGMAEVVRMVLAALVAAGWITLDNVTVNTIASVIGLIISIALTWWTRRTVTPTVKPRSGDGRPLVPAAPPTTLGTPPEPPTSP